FAGSGPKVWLIRSTESNFGIGLSRTSADRAGPGWRRRSLDRNWASRSRARRSWIDWVTKAEARASSAIAARGLRSEACHRVGRMATSGGRESGRVPHRGVRPASGRTRLPRRDAEVGSRLRGWRGDTWVGSAAKALRLLAEPLRGRRPLGG